MIIYPVNVPTRNESASPLISIVDTYYFTFGGGINIYSEFPISENNPVRELG